VNQLDCNYDFALRLAQESIPRLRKAFTEPHSIEEKPGAGIVTEADRAMEEWVRGEVATHLPGHVVLGEEEGFNETMSGPCWIVDPIDGTTNFAAGSPLFAFSLGLVEDGELKVAACADPMREEVWSAAVGRGAWLNGKPIRCSTRELSSESCFAIPSCEIMTSLDNTLLRMMKTVKLRNTGSTVLNACYTACGRFEFAYATNAYLWDIAAASLIVLEAGGRVTGSDGEAIFPLPQHPGQLKNTTYEYTAGCPHLHEQILRKYFQS
jgi:myo-inositol-1(or 4)-monophosphatase